MKWTHDNMAKAMAAVRRRQLTMTQAAQEFSVPRKTLEGHVKKQGPLDLHSKSGHGLMLSHQEEDALVEYVDYMSLRGFPLNRRIMRLVI